MSLFCKFVSSPRESCHALKYIASRKMITGFTARPYNFNDPDNSPWWLVPSTQWPAFRYGKYYFCLDNTDLLIGLYVEKGVREKASEFYLPASVINQSWSYVFVALRLKSKLTQPIGSKTFETDIWDENKNIGEIFIPF